MAGKDVGCGPDGNPGREADGWSRGAGRLTWGWQGLCIDGAGGAARAARHGSRRGPSLRGVPCPARPHDAISQLLPSPCHPLVLYCLLCGGGCTLCC